MRYKPLALSTLSLLFLLTTFQLAAPVARASDDDTYKDDDYGYEETARVARVSLLAGDVSLRRSGSDKWERASLNTPLVEGDRLATGENSRLEIQIDARNFLRVGAYATVDIVTLRAEGVALSLPEGTATLRLARFTREREYFEIDAPGTTIAAQAEGLYRLDVERGGKVRVSVREGGRARLYSENSGFTLRENRAAETVFYDNAKEPDWEFSDLRPFDNWDTWVDERERFLLARLRYDGRDRYYDNDVWGAEELDAYGDWVQTKDYGYVWRPRTTVINNYYNWAPYRYGRWAWVPPYGWTWVADEPWGWAPYHYGRWVSVDNRWCWAPRGYYGYRNRSWWRPALVAFVNVRLSFGDNICWYPLPYHHSDPHSNFWRRARDRERLTALRRDELANLQRVNPIYQRAVSGLPAREFGRGSIRAQPADAATARLALATDPVRGRLPVRPTGDDDANAAAALRARPGEGRRAAIAARGDGASDGDPARGIAERPTGAGGRRQPGVALDGELRRARIFNNREPVATQGANGDAGGNPNGDPPRRAGDGERGTGAFARPQRAARLPGATNARGESSGGDDPGRGIRPARPVNPDLENARPRGEDSETPARNASPARRERGGDDDNGDRRPTPERRADRPARAVEREARPAAREERQAPPPREERQAPPREEPSSPPPREERSAPPPREERSVPPPREEKSPPPPKSEEPSREAARPSRDRPPVSK